jgi:hypothetical protein
MQLYDELFKSVDGVAAARCNIVPRGCGYFEGVKAVGDFSNERIVLYFPRESVEIVGENLAIGKYYEGDLYLTGRIFSVAVLDKADERPSKKGG